ncbi:MAG: replication-relaxation family protein [Actinomycetota bacterium]|nr:replication-relaxation family protein [Actinomycetota bacterium]
MTGSITGNELYRLRTGLAERDWQVISTLAKVRLASSDQLEALHFAGVSRRRAQQRLAVLVERRVLARLPRVIGGVRAGSRGHVYALDVAGQRLADLDRGRRPRPPKPVGRRYIDHVLAVTAAYVRLVLAERAGSVRILQFIGEPGAWRTFFGPGGGRLTVNPDAYVVLLVNSDEDFWFLEVDLGTEFAPTLTRKCNLYRSYWQSGTEEARTGVFPRVLWLVPNERRAEVLRQVIRRQPGEAAELFDVALSDAVVERVLQGAAP